MYSSIYLKQSKHFKEFINLQGFFFNVKCLFSPLDFLFQWFAAGHFVNNNLKNDWCIRRVKPMQLSFNMKNPQIWRLIKQN